MRGDVKKKSQTSQTAGDGNHDAGNSVDLDADGNVYLAGSFRGNATFYSAKPGDKKISVASGAPEAIFLAKYTSSGTLLWVQTGTSDCGDSGCPVIGYGVAVNSAAATVYVASDVSGDMTFSSPDGSHHIAGICCPEVEYMVLTKYDTNGNFLWSQNTFTVEGSGGTGVAVDSNDNAYIVGWFTGQTYFYSADGLIDVYPFAPVTDQYFDYTGSDAFLAKYDKNGNARWVNHYSGYTASPGAVTVGPSGEVTLVGYTADNSFVNVEYETTIQTSTTVSSQPPGADINLGSGTSINPGNTDEVSATYNPAGVLISALRRGGTANESATGVAYDSRSNLYVTGLVEGTNQPQLFVDQYSGKNLVWEATASADAWTGQAAHTPALGVDAAGSVFVTGGYSGTASFGNIKLSEAGTSQVFVAELNTAFANQSADLVLRLSVSPTTVKQGGLLTYTFPVWNRGPNVAYLESLKTQVPAGTTFDYIRISGTDGLGTCTTPAYGATGPITCYENSSMAPNTTWTLRLTVKVTAPSGSVITESGTATEVTPDPNPASATATVSTTVQ